jgi:hypothetical protein
MYIVGKYKIYLQLALKQDRKTKKSDRHDIAEILLKVALNTITLYAI